MNDEIDKFFARGNDYWLTRFVILRLLGFVYVIAFLVAVNQLVPLIGATGLTPAHDFLSRVHSHYGSRTEGMLHMPTLFWFGVSDLGLSIFAWVGLVLSLIVLCGYANSILMALLWINYMSIVHIGNIFYGYGWEIQLLETGFLAIFLCPLRSASPLPAAATPKIVVWLFRWLIFRIMLGAALIKFRNDPCWRDLSCLDYHFETQPNPGPLAWGLHHAPHSVHVAGVLFNYLAELVAPW